MEFISLLKFPMYLELCLLKDPGAIDVTWPLGV